MTRKLTPTDIALWAALPMAHTSNVEKRLAMILDTSRRRAFPRRFPALALTGGVAALVSMAVLHPIARGQAASPASAALSRQHRASAEPKDANGHVRQVLLLKYYGEGWVETHPEAVSRAEWVRPLQAAALYGSWAEAYGGVRSGNTERFLLRAKALEPDNPQWPDRLGDLYSLETIHTSPHAARLQAQKALAQYQLAAHLLGEGPGVSQSMAITAFAVGEYGQARRYASDLLRRNAEDAAVNRTGGFPQDDERHHAHLVLGRLALRDGDTAGAEAHLLAMGRVSGSPVLDTFGPNMQLAQDLLEHGDRPPVLAYLDECAKFWTFDHGKRLNAWKAQVQEGKTPDFGSNLVY